MALMAMLSEAGESMLLIVSFFLPCVGFGNGASFSNAGSDGFYWSSVRCSNTDNYAWHFRFYSGDRYTGNCDRYFGYGVRPVREVSSSNILSMSGLKAAYFFDGNVNDSSSSGWNLASNGERIRPIGTERQIAPIRLMGRVRG